MQRCCRAGSVVVACIRGAVGPSAHTALKPARTALEVIAAVLASLAVFEIGVRVWNPLGPQFDLSRQWGDSPGELHMGVPDRKVALAPNKTATTKPPVSSTEGRR